MPTPRVCFVRMRRVHDANADERLIDVIKRSGSNLPRSVTTRSLITDPRG